MKRECPENLPLQPGVYFFKDKNNTILYIGKATSIRSRVQSYFAKQAKDWKIDGLLKEYATIEYVITDTELKACLLEAELIQTHKPKYNVLLTSGQPFLYLFISDTELPEMSLVRTKQENGTYIGPFLHKGHARGALRYVMETFRLSLCNKKIEKGCLDYHIGICAGSCRADFNPAEYKLRMALAQDALQENRKDFLQKLTKYMKTYSDNLEFEKAKHMRDYMTNLDVIFATLKAQGIRHEHQVVNAILPKKHGLFDGTYDDQVGPELQKLLKLEKPAHVIDCFDISHFQSTNLVGSCIRFTYGMPDKKSFRRFIIKTMTEQNDYAALCEVVKRRYKSNTDFPDLILIDGGKGQLSAVSSCIDNVPCASIAKREERLFSSSLPDGILLNAHTKVGKLIISLRDYTHHFALSYHRLRRNKAFGKVIKS